MLGLLGNSGNTDAPHLHFHVMDGPAPLASNGLPYEFTSFVGQGVASSLDPMMTGKAAAIDGATLAGPHSNQLPLNLQVISFPATAPAQ